MSETAATGARACSADLAANSSWRHRSAGRGLRRVCHSPSNSCRSAAPAAAASRPAARYPPRRLRAAWPSDPPGAPVAGSNRSLAYSREAVQCSAPLLAHTASGRTWRPDVVPDAGADPHARQRQYAQRRIQVIEHDLEQRRAARVARRGAAPPPAARTAGPGARRRPAPPRERGPSSSRKLGSPARSARSTSVLTKKPISPSVSAGCGRRSATPTTRSRCPDQRCSSASKAASSDHEQRRVLAAGRALAAPPPTAGERRTATAPAAVASAPAGRGRSVGQLQQRRHARELARQ